MTPEQRQKWQLYVNAVKSDQEHGLSPNLAGQLILAADIDIADLTRKYDEAIEDRDRARRDTDDWFRKEEENYKEVQRLQEALAQASICAMQAQNSFDQELPNYLDRVRYKVRRINEIVHAALNPPDNK